MVFHSCQIKRYLSVGKGWKLVLQLCLLFYWPLVGLECWWAIPPSPSPSPQGNWFISTAVHYRCCSLGCNKEIIQLFCIAHIFHVPGWFYKKWKYYVFLPVNIKTCFVKKFMKILVPCGKQITKFLLLKSLRKKVLFDSMWNLFKYTSKVKFPTLWKSATRNV